MEKETDWESYANIKNGTRQKQQMSIEGTLREDIERQHLMSYGSADDGYKNTQADHKLETEEWTDEEKDQDWNSNKKQKKQVV